MKLFISIACLVLAGAMIAQPALAQVPQTRQLSTGAKSHFKTVFNNLPPNNTPGAAQPRAGGFLHAPNGDWSKAHSDTIINYLTWDGTQWTARLEGNGFLHAPNGDWSKAHSDTIIN